MFAPILFISRVIADIRLLEYAVRHLRPVEAGILHTGILHRCSGQVSAGEIAVHHESAVKITVTNYRILKDDFICGYISCVAAVHVCASKIGKAQFRFLKRSAAKPCTNKNGVVQIAVAQIHIRQIAVRKVRLFAALIIEP